MNKSKKSIMIYNMLAGMTLMTSFLGAYSASADESKLQKVFCRINEYEDRNVLELDPYSLRKTEGNAESGPFGKTFASSEFFVLTVDLENKSIQRPGFDAHLGELKESTLYKILDKSQFSEQVRSVTFSQQNYEISKETSKNFSFENTSDVLVGKAVNPPELPPGDITIKIEVPKGERYWEGFFETKYAQENQEIFNWKLHFYCVQMSGLEKMKKTFGIQDPIKGE